MGSNEDALLRAGRTAPRPNVNSYPSFEVLADFIPQFVWMCTPDGLNVYFNQRWVDYTGLTLEESYGKGWNIPFHPEDKQAAWDAWNHATQTGLPYHVESRLRAADGSYRWFLMRGEPLKDSTGGVVHWFGSCTDINDLKLAQELLERQAALLELAHDAILVRGANNEVAFWNRGATELYGWTRQEAAGRVAPELLKTRFPKPLTEIYAEVEAHGRWEGELVHTRKDGREITVTSRWAVQRDASGNMIGVLEINRDITERKRAEQQLRESRDGLALAQQVARAGSFDLDLRTNVAIWSEELQQLYGIGPGESKVNMDEWAGWVLPEDLDRVMAEFVSGIEAGELTSQFRIRRRDNGEVRWIERRGRVLRDEMGAAIRMAGFSIEITGQKRDEEAAVKAAEQRRLALEASNMGAWDFHLDTGEVFWDARCAEMFGLSPSEISAEAIISRIHPDDQPAVRQALAAAQAGIDDGHYHVEYRVQWLDGTFHWITSHGRAYFAGSGAQRRAVRFVGVNVDTTDEKRAEDRLRQAQKLESLGLLAGGVAHDFNNLLVGVVGNASLALDLLPAGHPASDLIHGVLQSGEQAAHLTRQMLAYSGRGRFLVEALDLSALIPEMAGLVGPSIAKKITLHYDLAEGLPAVLADRGQVQQVFMNLVINAADAIGSQEGLITVRTGVEEVDQQYMRLHPETAALAAGRYACLEVRDTGCGMDEATKAKIFDPFFTTKFVGRGLGLAAVSGIIRGHAGGIVVASAPGKGSCFTVLFPVAANAALKDVPAATSNVPFQGTGVVLVVDDERPVRELAKRALERLGYTVLLAGSGLAAIEAAKGHPDEIALVVLDVSMPHMSGEEVLRELRKLRPDVRVMVSSGYSETEALSLFKGQEISGFIQKPYTLKRLAEGVAASLKR